MPATLARLAAGLALAASSGAALAAERFWSVSESSGRVVVTEQGKVRRAVRGTVMGPGASIATGAGSRAIIVRDREYVVLAPRTQLRLPAPQSRAGIIQMIADFGTAFFKIDKRPHPHFGVATPYSAAVVKGTTFRVSVDRAGAAVGVIEGAVQVSTRDGRFRQLVGAGLKAEVSAAAPDALRVAADPGAANPPEETRLLARASRAEAPREAAASPPRGQDFPFPTRLLSFLALIAGAAASLILFRNAAPAFPAAWTSVTQWARRRREDGDASPGAAERLERLAARKADAPAPPARARSRSARPAAAPPPAAATAVEPREAAPPPEPEADLGRRASKRARVLLSATLCTGDGELKGRLRDISGSGAVVEGIEPPPVGAAVILRSGGIFAEGEVVWAAPDKCGIRFDNPVSEADLPVQSPDAAPA
ncbi:MAG: FecR domain-containing protein [Alphaproteobacteria bacterium]|nr:FecR domain-containing protein [Alphaproteobacteria bacterium]MBV9371070.1 FecR domain-containing protein [Alphaproteobacteria bacterium]